LPRLSQFGAGIGLNPKTQALGVNLLQANPDLIQNNTFNYVIA
jgi:hypothetical protein